MRKTLLTFTALCATVFAPLALQTPAQAASAAAMAPTVTARVIVKYKIDSSLARMHALSANSASTAAQQTSQATALGLRLGLTLRAGAAVADRSHVVFASGMTSTQLAQRLAADSEVEYAVPDERRRAAVAPNDPCYRDASLCGVTSTDGQWYLHAPNGTAPSSINIEPAWTKAAAGGTVVVAVLDSGVRFSHPDLGGGNVLAGYDMIGDDPTANDNISGRDVDASDPGDWIDQNDVNSGQFGPCTSADIAPSSWHGTATAALIGAATNDNTGMAGVARGMQILPVRVLGKCGGFDSDIIAGMRWAAGLSVAGVPNNPNAAQVINLSLGGVGGCSQAYVDVMHDLSQLAKPPVVVASAGNGTGRAVNSPANCAGVIAVSGLRQAGSKVGYSDIGPETTISAPGGNCVNLNSNQPCLYPILTASNSGTTTPISSIYRAELGTSFSAPMVAGTVALMLSVDPTLTPLQVKLILQGTATPFPSSGGANPECTAPQYDSAGKPIDQDQCDCTGGTCGAGMLNAGAALTETSLGGIGNGVQARIDVDSRNAEVGRSLQLSGTNSIAQLGVGVASYLWTIVDSGGNVVTRFDSGGATATGSTTSVTPRAAGRFVVTLKATDGQGVSSTTRLAIVAGTPAALDSGGGGGGALGAGWLALLLAAVFALRASPRRG